MGAAVAMMGGGVEESWSSIAERTLRELGCSFEAFAAHLGCGADIVEGILAGAVPSPAVAARLRKLSVEARARSEQESVRRPPAGETWAAFIPIFRRTLGGISLDQMGELLGVSKEAPRLWQVGETPSVEHRKRMVALFANPPADLVRQQTLGLPAPKRPSKWVEAGIQDVREQPAAPSAGIMMLYSIWQERHVRGRVGCVMVAEGCEFSDGATAVRWMKPGTGIGPDDAPTVTAYPSTNALRELLAKSPAKFWLAPRDA